MSGYELVMPFVVCTSNGGPHEDGAFVAGFRLGGIREQVRRDGFWSGPVRDEDVPQLDLIAMERGLALTVALTGDGWVHAALSPDPTSSEEK